MRYEAAKEGLFESNLSPCLSAFNPQHSCVDTVSKASPTRSPIAVTSAAALAVTLDEASSTLRSIAAHQDASTLPARGSSLGRAPCQVTAPSFCVNRSTSRGGTYRPGTPALAGR
ncbi:hypothetical protein V494_00566 [Pseudogymnoascus sp. VKM F-4513 (FW-928)]|nr:hypothetical protein V494_00566 [Pseudogymnoascus sp. VKM F-4513 (FW-928)]